MQYPYFIIVFMPQRIHVSKTKGARFENQPSARNNNAFAMEMGKTSYACRGGGGLHKQTRKTFSCGSGSSPDGSELL